MGGLPQSVSACLATLDKRILLIDMDAQANATSGMGLKKNPGDSAYPVLLGEATLQEQIQPTVH